MEVRELLSEALALVPDAATGSSGSVAEARDYLGYNELEIAVDILADLREGWSPPPAWWDRLIEAADLMRLHGTAAWCRWGRGETLHGVIRASLRLSPSARALPPYGGGLAAWDIGGAGLSEAHIWVEYAPELPPGADGTVRLAPHDPPAWRSLRVRDRLTMHQAGQPAGTAAILELRPPTPAL